MQAAVTAHGGTWIIYVYGDGSMGTIHWWAVLLQLSFCLGADDALLIA